MILSNHFETAPLCLFHCKISQHYDTQDNSVDTEGGEGVFSHVFHEAPDHQEAHQEGDDAANDQHADFSAGGADAGEKEFQALNGRGAQHGGDGHEEGKFRAGRPAYADEDGAQDSRARPRGAGDRAQALEQADEDGSLVSNVMDIVDLLQVLTLIAALHQNKGDAVEDQGQGYHDAVMEVGIHPVVKEHAHDAGGKDSRADLEPEGPGILLFPGGFVGSKGVQLMEKQDDDRQDGTQLDHHIEHALKFLRHIQGNKFVQQNQMARGGNRQPFRNALHNAEEDGF